MNYPLLSNYIILYLDTASYKYNNNSEEDKGFVEFAVIKSNVYSR